MSSGNTIHDHCFSGLDRARLSAFTIIQGVLGRIYQLQRNETLDPGDWENVGEPVTGTGASIILSDPDAFSVPRCFYRVGIQP